MQSSIDYIKQSFELKNQKLYKEAIEMLYKVLSEDTDKQTTVEVISQIGDLHVLLKNYDRAIEEYLHVLEIEPEHSHSKNKLYDIYYQTAKYDKALSIAKQICADTNKPLDYVKYFNVLLKLNQVDEILKMYNDFDDNLKNDPYILYLVSLIKPNEKKEILEQIVKTSPALFEAKFDLAMVYYSEGNFAAAEDYFNEIITHSPNALSYYYKALIQISKEDFFSAIDNLHKAIKATNGAVVQMYFELTKVYIEVNWYEEAISTIKKAITLCIEQNDKTGTIDKCYLLLAWIFEKQKDFDNALFNLTLIEKDSGFYVQACILNALIKYEKGDIIYAKNELEKIYASNKEAQTDLTLLNTLGVIYKKLKLNNKACNFFEKHLAIFADSINTVCEYVDLLIDMENYDEAEALIEKYSTYGKVASFLNSRARIYYRLKDNKKALECLNELIEQDRNNAEAYYFRGLILSDIKNYTQALLDVETALALNPMPAKYYARAAYVNMELCHYEDAMLYAKEAIEIEPADMNYKKLAAQIAEKSGNKAQAGFWSSIAHTSEKLIKDFKKI